MLDFLAMNFLVLIGVLYHRDRAQVFSTKVFIYFFWIIVFAIFSLRGISGSDSRHYVDLWKKLTNFNSVFIVYNSEFLFFAVGWLIKFITENPKVYLQLVFTLQFSIMTLALYRFQKAAKTNGFLPLACYFLICSSTFYLLSTNVLRQGFAASIGLLSLTYLMSRHYTVFLLLCLIAFYFHHSAIFFLFCGMLALVPLTLTTLIILLTASLGLGALDLVNLVPQTDWLAYKLQLYRTYGTNHNFILKCALILTNATIFCWIGSKLSNPLYRFMIRFYLWGGSCVLLLINYPEIGKRLIYYCNLSAIILVAFLVAHAKHRQLVFSCALVFSFTYGMYVLSHESIGRNLGY